MTDFENYFTNSKSELIENYPNLGLSINDIRIIAFIDWKAISGSDEKFIKMRDEVRKLLTLLDEDFKILISQVKDNISKIKLMESIEINYKLLKFYLDIYRHDYTKILL